MNANLVPHELDFAENKDRIDAALVRLKSLKRNIVEIRMQVESIRKLREEHHDSSIVCSECRKEIDPGQEVTIKGQSGIPSRFYHKECFKAIWVSQTWRFDYSSPGFLKTPEKGARRKQV